MPTEHTWLCSAHFVSGKKSDNPLSPDYLPTIFNYVLSSVKRKRESDLIAFERRKQARMKREAATKEDAPDTGSLLQLSCVGEACLEIADHACSVPITIDEPPKREVATQTDLSMHTITSLEDECCLLRKEKCKLMESMEKAVMSMKSFESDNSKVKFYTGLPSFAILMAVYNFVAPHLPESAQCLLPKFQQFVMTLMKLRLNVSNQDIAYRFGISQATVSKTWRKWINVMFVRLKPLIKWPAREQVIKTMPQAFRQNFRKCVCIIDCFEVFCERPSSLMARAQTFSNYKHHNTVKFLIGIAPQGVISYVSKGWGGRVSDKYLTENCGILDKLQPGDQVLADRGFNVEESFGMYCAKIVTPPYTKGKKQLSRLEVETARQLSRVRIHVERVIGLLRQKYTLLESTLPINMIMCDAEAEFSMINKVVTVCCALCNCNESVVPFD